MGRATAASAMTVYALNEILRNFTSYISKGAYSYSHAQKFIVKATVEREVDAQMRRENLDPEAKQNAAEREKRLDSAFEQAMSLRGLPGQDEFLFDAITVSQLITETQGFNADLVPEEAGISESQFRLVKGRWGLALPALNKAIANAEKLNAMHGTATGRETLKVLKTLRDRFSYAQSLMKTVVSPITRRNYLREAKDVRKVLTLFSFSGDVNKVAEYFPSWLGNISNDKKAIRAAAEIYHGSLSEITEGNKDAVIVSDKSRDSVLSYLENPSPMNALDKVDDLEILDGTSLTDEVKENYEEAGNDRFLRQIALNKSLRTVKTAMEAKAEAERYEPEDEGWVAKHQRRRAHKLAKIEYEARMAAGEENLDYRRIYARKLAKKVGLHTSEESEFIDLVEQEALKKLEDQMGKPEVITYMRTLNKAQIDSYKLELFADFFLVSYTELAIRTDKNLDAASTERPGMFQSIRKWLSSTSEETDSNGVQKRGWKRIASKVVSFVQNPVDWTLRAGSSIMSNTSYQPGLLHWFDRRISVLPRFS